MTWESWQVWAGAGGYVLVAILYWEVALLFSRASGLPGFDVPPWEHLVCALRAALWPLDLARMLLGDFWRALRGGGKW